MRKIRCENYRVEIYPETYSYGLKLRDDKTVCLELVKDARRHLENYESINWTCDQILVCEFCGARWTEDDGDYNGGCCDKDEENHQASCKAKLKDSTDTAETEQTETLNNRRGNDETNTL